MKPVNFDYIAVNSVEEAVAALSQAGGTAKIIAGGQSLLPILNMRLARPSLLVDINKIPELNRIERVGNELRFGATVRHHQAETSPVVQEYLPLLAKAIPLVGHRPIRSRGTLVGSVVHADPSAEIPLVSLILDASLELHGTDGVRTVALADFFFGYMMNDLQADEVATALVFPDITCQPGSKRGTSFQEMARRDGDFALVSAAGQIDLHDGVIADVRLGVGGVGGAPQRLVETEDFLKGKEATIDLLMEAAEAIGDLLEPDDDPAVSAQYRRSVAIGLTKQVLIEAFLEASTDKEGGK
ncbi:FAD binding domain-containing protein [Brevibacillus sp. TJ4]|uniref:FAD binding domain-containing protein n=1 Tax=Brevibacillus sp. TJ4 TaxID=3234853 RepID=UPI003BA05225